MWERYASAMCLNGGFQLLLHFYFLEITDVVNQETLFSYVCSISVVLSTIPSTPCRLTFTSNFRRREHILPPSVHTTSLTLHHRSPFPFLPTSSGYLSPKLMNLTSPVHPHPPSHPPPHKPSPRLPRLLHRHPRHLLTGPFIPPPLRPAPCATFYA